MKRMNSALSLSYWGIFSRIMARKTSYSMILVILSNYLLNFMVWFSTEWDTLHLMVVLELIEEMCIFGKA